MNDSDFDDAANAAADAAQNAANKAADKAAKTAARESEALKRDFSRLRSSLDSVKDKLGTNAHEVLDRVTDFLESTHLGARLDDVEDELSRLGSKIKDTSRDATARVESEITAKPLASIAIAFGIGLLAASLLRRRAKTIPAK
jgi:ElaB/YqjD/DUF883 family membrane-anchored ribosome-binding protein